MNQVPNRRPSAPRPSANRAPARRAPVRRRRRLRPIAVVLLSLIVLLLCAIVFLVTYHLVLQAETARLQAEENTAQTEQGTPDTPTEGAPDTPNTPDTPDAPSTPEPQTPAVTFTSVSEIVSYVEGLGVDFGNLSAFRMADYFPEVTLKATADAGVAYQNETAYVGDSLVLHMTSRSDHPADLVYAAGGVTPEDVCSKKLTKLQNGTEATYAEALAERAPKRIVITIATNSMWMDMDVYLQFYSRFIDQLKAACPNAQIILQSAPPLTAAYEVGKRYPTNEKINRANVMVAGLASYHKVWFLNTADALKGTDGALKAEYDNGDGYHISAAAYDVWTEALRTHATTLQ